MVSQKLVQAMLSKVSEDTIIIDQYTQLVYTHEISGSLIIGLNYDTLKVDLNITSYSSAVKLYISDNEFGVFNIDATKTYSAIGSYSDTISKNALYTMALSSASNNRGTINIYAKPTIYKKGNGVLWKPIKLSLIWENTSINIFWEDNIKELEYTVPCIWEKNGNAVSRGGKTISSNYIYNNYAFYFCKETGYYKLKTVNASYSTSSNGYMFVMHHSKYYDQSLQFLNTYAQNGSYSTAIDTTLLLEKGTIIWCNNPGNSVAFTYSVQPITIKKVKI